MSKLFGMMMSNSGGDNILYAPVLDGSEAITTITGQNSPKILNNTFTGQTTSGNGGCGYLSLGWDNTVNWELNCKGYWYEGNCGICIYDGIYTSRDRACLKLTNAELWVYTDNGGGIRHSPCFPQMYAWNDITITKINSTKVQVKITYFGTSKLNQTVTWNDLALHDKVFIGVDTWGAGNTYYSSVKDIVVTKVI